MNLSTAVAHPGAIATFDAGRDMQRRLEAIGWQLLNVEVDLDAGSAQIELRRDELHVLFDARNGRASITRELHEVRQERIGRKGDVTVVDRIEPRFIGRTRCEGLRAGLRELSNYVADNAPAAIDRDRARDLFRPLLQPALPAVCAVD